MCRALRRLLSKTDKTVGKEVLEALDEWREYFIANTIYKDSPYYEYLFLTKQGTLREYNCFKRQFKNFLTRKGFDGYHINLPKGHLINKVVLV